MLLNLHFCQIVCFSMVFLCRNAKVKAAKFAFLADNPNIFEDCTPKLQNYLGVKDVVDVSSLQIEFHDENVRMEGNITILYDAKPSDRLELRADVLKYERGTWQPTIYSMVEKDFCAALQNKASVYYEAWVQYVDGEFDCIKKKGQVYTHKPFDFVAVFNIPRSDVSGRYKVQFKVNPVNELETVTSPSTAPTPPFCLELEGDVIKMKNQ